MLQIQWFITWLMMIKASTKQWQVTGLSGMSCSPETGAVLLASSVLKVCNLHIG